MAQTATLNAKITAEEKAVFARTCDELGTTPSSAIRMFVSAFNRRGGFPFPVTNNPLGFNQETLDAMRDAATGRNLSRTFDSVEAMFEDIGV